MKKRQGQALIIVVIIIAVIMAVFANSLTTRLRYHAQEETEIYQREQALYLAEMGINQMIFNINSGTTYNEGDTITGSTDTGSYTTVYHTSDDHGFGGNGRIESTGTVGEISRKVFVSVVSLRDAFKYCLYTSKGGRDGIAKDSYFTNKTYGDKYNLKNGTTYTVPYPDPNFYSYKNPVFIERKPNNNNTYTIQGSDLGNVIFIHPKNTNVTLRVDFRNIYNSSFSLSIITDAKNVTIKNLYPYSFFTSTTTWSGAENSKDDNKTYPILVHLGNGTTKFKLTTNYTFEDWTLKLNGFLYTAGAINMKYIKHKRLRGGTYGEIDGEVMENNPQSKLGGQRHDTRINYTANYYKTPPPHFIIPTKIFPGSFREEY